MIKNKNRDDIVTNMLIIQGRVKVLNGEIKVNSNEYTYIGTKLSDIEDMNLKEKIKKTGVTDESFEKYYLLSREDLSKLKALEELKKADDNQYIVSYDEVEVIYIEGISDNDNTKYKLSDILNK